MFWNSPTSEAQYHVMDALVLKFRGRWARLAHLSADNARDSGRATMCSKARYTLQSCCPPSYTELTLDSIQTKCEQAACLHDATYGFDREDNLDEQSDKQGNTRTDRAVIYGRSSYQKESPVDWTPHEDVTRQLPKQVLYSQLFSCHTKRGRPHLRF